MATARIRGPQPGIATEIQLERRWGVIASTTWALVISDLFPVYSQEFATRGDSPSTTLPRSVSATLTSMRIQLVDAVPKSRLRAATAAAGAATNVTNAAAFNRQLSAALGIPVRVVPRGTNALITEWIKTATDKITSVRDGAIPGLREDLEEAWTRGLTTADLEQRWRRRGLPLNFGTVEGRTKVIARDQIGKLNGNLTELRHRAMGVLTYTWRTSADSQVRVTHRRREGRRFSWNKPPRDGHPGQPVQCRCAAEALVNLDTVVKQPEVRRFNLSTLAIVAAAAVVAADG